MRYSLSALFLALPVLAHAQVPKNSEVETIVETIDVYGQSPISSHLVGQENIIGSAQTLTGEDLSKSQALSLADHLKNRLTSVNINDVQNNPFQPDVQYRGFTASPLLGLPQGISVYLNGSRFNEPFGDTVNWDLIPLEALDRVTLYSGSNPAFGHNTLGGALALNTKNGFSYQQQEFDLTLGSFGQKQYTMQSGGNNGTWGYYVVANSYQEQGWRDYSPSDIKQVLATLSYEHAGHKADLTVATSNNDLYGNGAIPEDLMELESRRAIYTQPDRTTSRFKLVSLNTDSELSEDTSIQFNAYYRYNKINTLNGDDSDYGECEIDEGYTLCEGDDDDDDEHRTVAGLHDDDDDDDEELEPVHFLGYDEGTLLSQISDIDADDIDGTLNTSYTENKSYGAAVQLLHATRMADINSQFVLGAGYDKAKISFTSGTEFALLKNESVNDDRSVAGIGLYDAESQVFLKVDTESYYAYFSNSFDLTQELVFNVAGRYNHAHILMQDQIDSGEGSLNGDHKYSRFNPAASLNYRISPEYDVKLSYSESSRTPNPAELSCADENDPCKLPNGFVADPPLEQVVAKTKELSLYYHTDTVVAAATVYSTISKQDIIFQQAGDTSNEGYFINVDETQREGFELSASTKINDFTIDASYNLLKATFESSFVSFSPVNPLGANRQVSPGDTIPGQPKHQIKLHVNWQMTNSVDLGSELSYASSQYYRGDEANENKQIASHAVTNLYLNFQASDSLTLSARINNLFDRKYNTFGTYGEADEVLGELYPEHDFDAYFVGPARPRAASVSLKYVF